MGPGRLSVQVFMEEQGVSSPTMNAIEKSISKAEMARHCRRRTRGVEKTAKGIEALLLQFTPATDTLGVPLFRYLCIYIHYFIAQLL